MWANQEKKKKRKAIKSIGMETMGWLRGVIFIGHAIFP